MNKVEKLSTLLGGKEAFGRACGLANGALVHRWIKTGTVPVKYNIRIRAHAAAQVDRSAVWREAVNDCLEPDVCQTCGQELHGRAIG
jgi:hypothetical protein